MNKQSEFNQPPHSADLAPLTFFVLLCRASICFGIIVALAPLLGTFGLLMIGLGEDEDFLFLTNEPLWHIYLKDLLVAVYGVLLFAGGKWCLERKKLGWHLMSFFSLLTALLLTRLIINVSGEAWCMPITVPLALLFTASYVYLFTDRPRAFLNVTRPKLWQIFSLHIALYLLLYFLFSLL